MGERPGDGGRLALLTLAAGAVALALAASGFVLGGPAPRVRPVDLGIDLGVAFAGGLLALLSPCSGAVLPAFFAYGFEGRRGLLAATYAFYLGLATAFVPLGFAGSLVANAVLAAPGVVPVGLGVVLLLLGVATLAGAAPSLAGVPGVRRLLAAPERAGSPLGRAYLVGVAFAFATASCVAPILGGVTALAAAGGAPALRAVPLLLAFALGIAAPLFVLALGFERWGGRLLRRVARATVSTPWGRVPATRAATGMGLVTLGALFTATRGTLTLTGAYDAARATDLAYRLNGVALDHPRVALLLLLAFLGAVGASATVAGRRRRRPAPETEP